jgi:glucan-binding YG repeat protein
MKMNEVTNAEDQLALLRLIIDNTWTAIRQEAAAQARQKASSKAFKPRASRQVAPRAPALKPANVPQVKPTQQISKPAQPNQSSNTQLTPAEREELAKNTATQMGLAN